MKKNYSKPVLLFEDFRLMDAIASCTPGLHSAGFNSGTGDCYIVGGDGSLFPFNVFTSTNDNCVITSLDFYDTNPENVVLFGS